MAIEIRGRVRDRQTGNGTVGLRVDMWDTTEIARTEIDADGAFRFEMDERELRLICRAHREGPTKRRDAFGRNLGIYINGVLDRSQGALGRAHLGSGHQ